MVSPFVKIGWNKYEVVLLVESYKDFASGEVSRKDAVSTLSKRLRNRMLLHGIDVSDKYRNENSINLQMSAVEFCLTNGEKGIDGASKLFHDIAQMALNDIDSYSVLLKEAVNMYPKITPIRIYEEPIENILDVVSEPCLIDNRTIAVLRTILSKRFSKGFRKSSSIDKRRLLAFYRDTTGMEFDNTDEVLLDAIQSCGIEINQQIFIPESLLEVNTRESIFKFISNTFVSGKSFIFYDQIFKQFHNELLDSSIVDNVMLRVYLQYYNGKKWFFGSKYISVSKDVSVSVDDEVIEFVSEQGRPVTEDEVIAALDWLPESDVQRALNRNSSILITSARNTKFHINLFVISDNQLEQIAKIINKAILKYEFIGAEELISDLKTSLPEVLANNSSITDLGIRKSLAVRFEDDFSFNNAIISKKGHNLTSKDALLNFARTHESFSLQEIDNLAESLGTVLNYYLESILDCSLRINDETFVSRENIQFDVSSIDDTLERIMSGGLCYILLRRINNFSAFPEFKFPWNQRLLESYLLTYSHRFGLLYSDYLNKNNICGAIIKKANCNGLTFEDVIAKALAESKIIINKNNALDFLATEGYIVRRRYAGIENVLSKAKNLRRTSVKQLKR